VIDAGSRKRIVPAAKRTVGRTMTTNTVYGETQLRQGFKYFNRSMLLLWRLGLGRWVNSWPSVGGRILVLTTVGRKSGRLRRTPLNYAIVDGDVYCVAGFGSISDWYRNIRANPAVEVWLPDGWWAGVAEDVTDGAVRLPLLRQVLMGSGIVAPLAGVNPHTLTDEALAAATASYHLIRIHRTAARTGSAGPGDLAWVWPLSTIGALLLLVRRSSPQCGACELAHRR
jgi:deazaflavin-dependent oxidoreductase (nitroreductase family)